jgi:hypothetical protein
MGEGSAILEGLLAIFIIAGAIGVLWVINTTIGSYISPPYWLVIIGAVGIGGIYVFVRARSNS